MSSVHPIAAAKTRNDGFRCLPVLEIGMKPLLEQVLAQRVRLRRMKV